MTHRERAAFVRPFWPQLEPSRVRARAWCYDCRTGTRAGHASSRRHRRLTRPLDVRRGSGDWLRERPTHLRDPYGDTRDWDAEQAAAMA